MQRAASIADPEYREQLLANPDAFELDPAYIDDGHVIVATSAESLCGFVVLLPEANGESELDGLFVDPEF